MLVDTNFINFSIQNKLDMVSGMMDCLFAKCVPCITDCVVGELEKLGSKFRVAQRYVEKEEKGREMSSLLFLPGLPKTQGLSGCLVCTRGRMQTTV